MPMHSWSSPWTSRSSVRHHPKRAADSAPPARGEQAEMSPPESPASGADAPVRRTASQRVAVRRLEAALVEQARVGELYARSVGTSMEQSAYARLQAAPVRVTECDRRVKAR